MSREALRVQYEQLREQFVPKCGTQRRHLVPSTGSCRRRVCRRLVGEVHAVRRDLRLAYTVYELDVFQEPPELGRDMPSVECGAMEGRVGILRGEEAGADRGGGTALDRGELGASLAVARFGLEDHPYASRAQDHAGTAPVEGAGGVLDGLLRRRGSQGAESGSEPRQQRAPRAVVPRHDHHPLGPSRDEHVLRHADGLGRARARRVRLRVRSAASRELRQLGVPQYEDAE
mmetsp:Transcript_27634/g.66567  ORF Transcript_27634/g.66567 Transcript_27634/m.66567 type:complete len:231 (-) Transcript_27634:112-804(-)